MFERKHVLLVMGALLGVLILMAACIASEKQVAVASGHPDWKPVMYKDGNNIAGTGVEITKKVFTDNGIKIDSRYVGSWDIVQEKARTGEIDIIVAAYKTKEREEYLVFSDPYMSDPIVLFSKTGREFTYSQKENLIGKKGVATIGDSYGQELDDYILQNNLNMVRVSTPEQAFALLNEEKVDYFIYSMYAGRKVITASNLSNVEESKVVSSQPFYIAVSKKSPYASRIGDINSSLKKLIANGEITI